MKKRVLSLVLVITAVLTLFGAVPVAAAAEGNGTCGEDLT